MTSHSISIWIYRTTHRLIFFIITQKIRNCRNNFITIGTNKLQSAKPPVHLFKTKRFYFEVLFQNEASLLEQNQTAFKWTSNPI